MAEESFYKRLNRLFRSGPAIRRKIKGQDYKGFYDNSVVRSNQGQLGVGAYKRDGNSFSSGYGMLDRMVRFQEYVDMDATAEVSAALDIYADESCASDENGKSFHIFSDNPQIQKALEELFYDVANIEFDARRWFRNLVKYGDFFVYVEVVPDYGVIKVEPVPVHEIEREEGYDKQDPYAIRFKHQGRMKHIENWQILHFRIIANDLFLPYGTCHEGSTKIALESGGVKEIRNIIPGDRVVSFDTAQQKKVGSTVLGVKCAGTKSCLELKTRHNYLKTTKEHWILTVDSQGVFEYRQAGKLTAGDRLVIDGSNAELDFVVEPIESIADGGEHETFDIMVDSQSHNFYANGIVTHNSFLESGRRVFKQLCHGPDTKVWVKNSEHGWKYIPDVVPGETVYSFDPDTEQMLETTVKHCVQMGVQKLVKVSTSSREIEVTPNHGLLVYDFRRGYCYKQAKELIAAGSSGGWSHRTADRLVLPTANNGLSSVSIEMPSNNYSVKLSAPHKYDATNVMNTLRSLSMQTSQKNAHAFLRGKRKIRFADFVKLRDVFDLPIPKLYYRKSKKQSLLVSASKVAFETTASFVRLFGFMLGDGWVNKNNIGFALGVNSAENEYYISLAREFCGNYVHMGPKEGSRGGQVRFNSKELADLFRLAGFRTGYANKRIPSWVYELHPSLRRELLQGLLDADGGDSGSLTLTNKLLVEDVQHLCQVSGFRASRKIATRKAQDRVIYGVPTRSKEACSIVVNLKKCNSEPFVLQTVLSVAESREAQTWDLEVDHQVHNFTANGVISHNTLMEDAMLVYRLVKSPERRVFYIDVSAVHPNDIPTFMETVKETMRGNNTMDRLTGRQDIRYNPLSITEDYFLPSRPNSQTKIETLAGGTHVSATEDVEYLQKKLIAALKVPRAYLTFDESLCVVGTTKIPVFTSTPGESRAVTIKELSEKFADGAPEDIYVYSVNDRGQVVPGKVLNAWKTKTTSDLVKVTLDNGESVVCTPNHPFMLRSREHVGVSYKEARDLSVGESLMPFVRRISDAKTGNDKLHGYEKVYQPQNGQWVYTHRTVENNCQLLRHPSCDTDNQDTVVHHMTFDKLNNHPDVLMVMSKGAHVNLHRDIATNNLLCPESRRKLKAIQQTAAYKAKLSASAKQSWVSNDARKRIVAHANRTFGKIAKMQRVLEAQRVAAMPTIQQLRAFIKQFIAVHGYAPTTWDVVRGVGCSRERLKRDLLGGRPIHQYVATFGVVRKPDNKTLTGTKPEDHVGLAASSKTIAEFVSKVAVDRKSFVKFLGSHGIDARNWYTENLNINNHKVVSVEVLNESHDVYDLTVENYHNFAIENAVFVHNSSKASLAMEDTRFSRTINVLQKIVLAELNKLAIIHLFAKGFDGEDLLDFELRLSNPSTVALQQKLAVVSSRIETAAKAWELAKDTGLMDHEYIQKEILGFRDDDIIRMRLGAQQDQVRMSELKALAERKPQTDREEESVVDPFNSSNYQLPTSAEEQQTDNTQRTVVKPPAPAASMPKVKTGNRAPIKPNPTPNLDAAARRSKRGKEFTGIAALSMPDFNAMLSPNNRYAKDIYDNEFLRGQIQELFSEETTKSSLRVIPPGISPDLVSALRRLDESLRKDKQMVDVGLITEAEHPVDDDELEELLEKKPLG